MSALRDAVFASSDGECPSCRKPLDAPVNAVEKGEAPWAAELPERMPNW